MTASPSQESWVTLMLEPGATRHGSRSPRPASTRSAAIGPAPTTDSALSPGSRARRPPDPATELAFSLLKVPVNPFDLRLSGGRLLDVGTATLQTPALFEDEHIRGVRQLARGMRLGAFAPKKVELDLSLL